LNVTTFDMQAVSERVSPCRHYFSTKLFTE
jgi:hypothetical protein